MRRSYKFKGIHKKEKKYDMKLKTDFPPHLSSNKSHLFHLWFCFHIHIHFKTLCWVMKNIFESKPTSKILYTFIAFSK